MTAKAEILTYPEKKFRQFAEPEAVSTCSGSPSFFWRESSSMWRATMDRTI